MSDDAPTTSRSPAVSDRSTSDSALLRLMTRLRTVSARALPCIPRCVLHVVADHVSRKNGLSWPKVETIAQEAGVSESTAREALALLVRCGWLRVVTEATPRDSARYEVMSDGKPVDEVEHPRRRRVPPATPLVTVPPTGTQGAATHHPDSRQPAPRVPPASTQGAASYTRSSHKAPSEALREPPNQAPLESSRSGQAELFCSSEQDPPPPKPRGRKPLAEASEAAQKVFQAFLKGRAWRGVGVPLPVLDAKRCKIVAARVAEGFPVETLAAAAQGIWVSDWHWQKDQTRFDLALRDAEQIERFAALHHQKLAETEQRRPAEHERAHPPPPPPPPAPLDEQGRRVQAAFIAKYAPEAVAHG